jgi:hypothetical protein
MVTNGLEVNDRVNYGASEGWNFDSALMTRMAETEVRMLKWICDMVCYPGPGCQKHRRE